MEEKRQINIINSKKVEYTIMTQKPIYNITLTGTDGEWTISGTISDINEEQAQSMTIFVTNDIEQIYRNTKEARTQHRKGIRYILIPTLSILGVLIVAGIITKVRLAKQKPEIIQESEPEQQKTITLYAVSTSTNIFEYMGDLEKFQGSYGINVATLRGVQSLNDEDYKKYEQALQTLNSCIYNFKQNENVDLNKFLETTMSIYDYSSIALKDINENKKKPEESDNFDILFDNYWTANCINNKSKYIGKTIEDAMKMKKDYPQSTTYDFSEGYVYGIKMDEIQFFSTLEEAKQYQEQITNEFESHLKEENHEYEDIFYDGHRFYFTIKTTQYEAPMTEEEMKEVISSGKTYLLKKDEIYSDINTDFGK